MPGSAGWSFEGAAELLGLLEVPFHQVRRSGSHGVEADVLDVGETGDAESPVVGDLADGVADAVVVGVLAERSSRS